MDRSITHPTITRRSSESGKTMSFSLAGVDHRDLSKLLDDLQGRRATVFTLEGDNIRDERSFFDEAVSSLPMGDATPGDDPSDWASVTDWNAFADFLWQGLTEIQGTPIAILWQHSDRSEVSNRQLVTDALEAFEHVGNTLRDKQLRLYLVNTLIAQ